MGTQKAVQIRLGTLGARDGDSEELEFHWLGHLADAGLCILGAPHPSAASAAPCSGPCRG